MAELWHSPSRVAAVCRPDTLDFSSLTWTLFHLEWRPCVDRTLSTSPASPAWTWTWSLIHPASPAWAWTLIHSRLLQLLLPGPGPGLSSISSGGRVQTGHSRPLQLLLPGPGPSSISSDSRVAWRSVAWLGVECCCVARVLQDI